MHHLNVGGATIDKCENCHGIWLDGGERAKVLQDKKTLKAIDAGSRKVGQRQDTIQAINCPRCGIAMRHLQHPEQKHVGFEHCDNCGGSYFDAGELSDLASFDFADLLRHFPGLRR
jgi:Zn-finger nucleic acid-binding protein